MGRLVTSGITSLDGYLNDETGSFDWAEPDEELHAFVNDLERPISTYLYGRRMYEVMSYWADPPAGGSAVERDYAQLWQAADKVVHSTTLPSVSTPRTTLVRAFDPDSVAAVLAHGDASVSGPGLAAAAFAAGLVDEVQLFVVPVVVGGGTRLLPDRTRLALELLDERRFRSGVVHLRYAVRR